MTSWNPEKLSEFQKRNGFDPNGRSSLAISQRTIFTVADAIRRSGVQETQAQRIIEEILNCGIVFREIRE